MVSARQARGSATVWVGMATSGERLWGGSQQASHCLCPWARPVSEAAGIFPAALQAPARPFAFPGGGWLNTLPHDCARPGRPPEGQNLVTERQGVARRPCHVAALAFVTASALLGLPAGGARAAGDGQPIRLTDAAERGAFNVGAAEGTVSTAPGPARGGEVLKFDYRMPRGTAAGVWTKGFPEGLDADHVDVVDVGVKVADPRQLRHVAVAV